MKESTKDILSFIGLLSAITIYILTVIYVCKVLE